VGRSTRCGTTHEFLEFFALKARNALPPLREFHELTEEHQEIVDKALLELRVGQGLDGVGGGWALAGPHEPLLPWRAQPREPHALGVSAGAR
jgi:hypothetical protein